MVLSNAERQARYKARLKQQALRGQGLTEAIVRFLYENPGEIPDGATPEEEADRIMLNMTAARDAVARHVDGWREFCPTADFTALDAALRVKL